MVSNVMSYTGVAKAAHSERARIEALIAGQEARVRRAFRTFLDAVKSDAARREVRLVLERRDVDAALAIVDTYVVSMGDVVASVFADAGAQESAAIARKFGRSAIGISFDPSNPRAALVARYSRLEFVREFTVAQRAATRAALTEALQTGQGPIQTARAFRDSIGLTEAQRQAVIKYRTALEAGDAEVLSRGLRDRRFDPSVRRLLDADEPLGAERINRMVEQYRTRSLQYRAEVIARTETQVVVNQARQEALTQAQERAALPDSAIQMTWRATSDARTRDTHAAMDGQVRPKGAPFVSPSGAQMMYPGDRSLGAPASEIIQCRCVVLTTISV